jgi:hypothetical protein
MPWVLIIPFQTKVWQDSVQSIKDMLLGYCSYIFLGLAGFSDELDIVGVWIKYQFRHTTYPLSFIEDVLC